MHEIRQEATSLPVQNVLLRLFQLYSGLSRIQSCITPPRNDTIRADKDSAVRLHAAHILPLIIGVEVIMPPSQFQTRLSRVRVSLQRLWTLRQTMSPCHPAQ